MAGGAVEFEYQRLHGMGEALYEQIAGEAKFNRPCRIYAPVGGHEDLLGYLVRRLLENGANTSFVNRLGNDEMSVSEIIADPVEIADREFVSGERVPLIVRPRDIFLPERKNSAGALLVEASVRRALQADISKVLKTPFASGPIINGNATTGGDAASLVVSPHDHRERIGTVRACNAAESRRRARRSHDRGGRLGANGRFRAGAHSRVRGRAFRTRPRDADGGACS